MYGRGTWNIVYSSCQVPQKNLGSCTCTHSGYQALVSDFTEHLGTRLTLPYYKHSQVNVHTESNVPTVECHQLPDFNQTMLDSK